ncbi:retrovirus-related pol polyprotein from transposon TNT 1-94 [Tanacetum coccineum]|uniref:Retrovirus-related pol polyprotein from transposon TNT 1-94 n=1 Tax=Tanacetum coccineum TaxID=301880 RepID=A0ABQ5BYX7_9ASTR
MADSAWIEAMQEELHQFDRLQVWELVGQNPFGKEREGIDFFEESFAPIARLRLSVFLSAYGSQVFSNLSDGRENAFLNGLLKEEVYVTQPDGFVGYRSSRQSLTSKKALYG